MEIYVGDTLVSHIYTSGPDYTAIQGPCDSGFHIPSTAERTAVLNVIGTSGDDYFTYLHIPKCGYRDRKTTNIITTYGFSRYWTYDMTAKDKADCWGIEANNVAQMYADDKPANGYPIRAFKDNPITPDSDWTETMSGKVWYNATLGLISIKNGSDWITIADKNLGATVVYNNGDTVNNSNAGSFFQFGNYYGFPYSGTLSTYTSLQNTTGYGWQNPYSDSHFVKINSNNWFSNTNNDIRGGVTGVIAPSEVQEVYEGPTKIRPPSTPFTPGANTIFYFPFDSDATDHSGNGFTLSNTGTQATIGRTFDTAVNLNQSSQGGNFVSVWMNLGSQGSGYSASNDGAYVDIGNAPGYLAYCIWDYYGGNNKTDKIQFTYSGGAIAKNNVGARFGTWIHLCRGYSSSDGAVCFINGVKYTISTNTPANPYGTNRTKFIQNKGTTKAIVTLSDVILETAVWSDQKVSDYFNATKSKYGVS